MQATDILKSEHRVIESVLKSITVAAQRLDDGLPMRPAFFLEATDFIRNFADGCHHRKEEGVLFKAMQPSGMPVQGGPIGVMLSEHEQGRELTRAMQQAADRLQSGNEAARRPLAQAARGDADLLYQHILKEDNILFPMAERVIPANQQDQVLKDFENVEHDETGPGIHEKYLALAQALQDEIAALKKE